jgi:hypothetical protein
MIVRQNNINYSSPDNIPDISEVISKLSDKYNLSVKNGAVKMRLFSKEENILHKGKNLKVTINAFCGQVFIDVKEV